MENFRIYGKPPLKIVVVHGGPGAPGEMEPVAKQLSVVKGVIEPFQTADTVNSQAEELNSIIRKKGSLPVILIGYSWGAWLGFILAAKYPSLLKKLILVGSGPFESKYAENIMKIRLNRLENKKAIKVNELIAVLNNPESGNKDKYMNQLGKLLSEADTYCSIPHKNTLIKCQYDIYQSVWPEADKLRKTGQLLKSGKKIKCPVIIIHGDYDPHPVEGVIRPLLPIIKDLKFFLLKKCGHKPWIEKYAKDKFYRILENEL
ncbi:alpha/beta hydrolase [Candidatus Woesearchaeota archaeon]|nr:alpha/beta hydrolase [Candidatus Woesearchaeota archaeon]